MNRTLFRQFQQNGINSCTDGSISVQQTVSSVRFTLLPLCPKLAPVPAIDTFELAALTNTAEFMGLTPCKDPVLGGKSSAKAVFQFLKNSFQNSSFNLSASFL